MTAQGFLSASIPVEFLYKRSGDFFTAEISVACRLMESYESPVIIDTCSKKFVLQKKEHPLPVTVNLEFRSDRAADMLLECKITDINKNVFDIFYLHVDRSTPQSRNYFNVVSAEDGTPVFSYILSADSFQIIHKDTSFKNLFVQYYHRDFPLSAPPFSFDYHESFDYKPDSIFSH
jgi:hypothetical protein